MEAAGILEVVTHVAAGCAHEIAGLQVHPPRVSDKGTGPQRQRADGAGAWRVALQVNSPAARRLHSWSLTMNGGRIVEPDGVGTHDEMI